MGRLAAAAETADALPAETKRGWRSNFHAFHFGGIGIGAPQAIGETLIVVVLTRADIEGALFPASVAKTAVDSLAAIC